MKGSAEDEIPDGFYSREQLQEAFEMTKENTCKIIKKYIHKNPKKVVVRKLKRRNSSGTISIIPYYKIDL